MPRAHIHEFLLDIDRDRLFRALADLKRWPEWDDDILAVGCEGPPRAGSRFTLRLKDGSAAELTVEALEPPALFVDRAKLPLARMVSRHELLPAEGGRTRLRHVIETSGPLGWLWDRLVARKIAAGLPRQAERMAAYARGLPLRG
ncbi:MAG TPA: SRPBCC family protein [Verrucomicrobiae bacterium]|nr:SRPBCC family protein [Verrucomicrobiae bacterium]